jgi:hypothetical protein
MLEAGLATMENLRAVREGVTRLKPRSRGNSCSERTLTYEKRQNLRTHRLAAFPTKIRGRGSESVADQDYQPL